MSGERHPTSSKKKVKRSDGHMWGSVGEGPDCFTSAKLQVLGLQIRATPGHRGRTMWLEAGLGVYRDSDGGLRGLWKAGRGSQYLTGSEFPDCASGNPQFPTGYHGTNQEVAQGS